MPLCRSVPGATSLRLWKKGKEIKGFIATPFSFGGPFSGPLAKINKQTKFHIKHSRTKLVSSEFAPQVGVLLALHSNNWLGDTGSESK